MNIARDNILTDMSVLSDLHVHTEYSDGSDSPDEVIELAGTLGIRYLALTDHDTAHWFTQSGTDAYIKAESYGISLIRGIEVSARDYDTGKKAHILGYWPGCEPFVPLHLLPFCKTIQERRTKAAHRQIEILQNLGYPITLSDVENSCKADQIFKHHILKTLYSIGAITDIMGDFYRQHFRRGGDCFIDIEYVPAHEVIAAIRADHGYAVLAHPGQQKNYASIPSFVKAGLMGIEYLHPSHTREDRALILSLSDKYGLFRTGGSDYHGLYHPGRPLGSLALSPKDTGELIRQGLFRQK